MMVNFQIRIDEAYKTSRVSNYENSKFSNFLGIKLSHKNRDIFYYTPRKGIKYRPQIIIITVTPFLEIASSKIL